MVIHSDFLFSTSFPALAGLSTMAAKASTLVGSSPGTIVPAVEIARLHAKQTSIMQGEAALFGLLFLFSCCMMRPPKEKNKFYNDSDDEASSDS